MIDTLQNDKTDLSSAYEKGLFILKEAFENKKIFSSLPKPEMPLSSFEFLALPALPHTQRKMVVKKYLHEDKILNIAASGVLAWAIINTLEDYDDKEKLALENHFIKCEEYFDCKVNTEGLLPTGEQENWLKSAKREGILIENEAFHAKILDVLYAITDDDLYDFKKKRLTRVVRDKLDGAYVLDRVDSLEIRPNNFIAAFFAPELFMSEDWQKTFDMSLKKNELWLGWGGLRTLGGADQNYNPAVDGESWFFINNMAAIVLHKLDGDKYADKINKILESSAENASWQEHAGRPCEAVLTSDRQIKVQGLYGLSLSTFIYLYRMVK